MTRIAGAKNIIAFDKRENIDSSPNEDIRHLATASIDTSLAYFVKLIAHQKSYVNWIKTRHKDLQETKKELSSIKIDKKRGPKDAIFQKYKWYSEYLVLLEAINAFEVFYKRSIINLAKALRNYVPADRLKGAVDAKILWSVSGRFSIPELLFEHQLYHDLDNVDKACDALILSKRYNKNNPKPNLKKVIGSLQAIFQVRHTLSHNHGLLTQSDVGKLKVLGYESTFGEVIDPDKNDLGQVISRFLENEAKEFTDWLLDATVKYLRELQKTNGVVLTKRTRSRIERGIGTSAALSALTWEP